MTKISNTLKKSVLKAIRLELATLGFEQRKSGRLVLPVNDDVVGTVGLNVATGRGSGIFEVNPVIGVKNLQLEKQVAEFCNEPFDELGPATLSGNIGYLSPADCYQPFLFTEGEDIGTTVEALGEAVKMYGLPFIRRTSNLEQLVKDMQTVRFGFPHQLDYRIPVGMLLLGDRSKSASFLAAKLEGMDSREDPAALRYKRFAKRLSEKLGE